MRLVDESLTLRRIARRASVSRARPPRPEAPQHPVGAKLELTYACNLRCGFCYTDSPRHTVAKTPELSDEEWGEIVGGAIDLGIVEAVLTGGEPFLRRDLTLALIDRLARAGVGVTLNTNGWFVDGDLARRLADVPGLHVHVSLDGIRPDVHDAARGVPGSWRRAVEAMHHMLEAGIAVHAVHVVTPQNESEVADYLELVWALGLPALRVTGVLPMGAAARGGRWTVDRSGLGKTVESFKRRRGPDMHVLAATGSGASVLDQGRVAPAAFLVRPDGRVRPDSLTPFTFGHARKDGLAACWQRIRKDWAAPEVGRWARSIKSTNGFAEAGLIPYLDEEAEIGQSAPLARSSEQRAVSDAQPVPLPVARRAPEDRVAATAEARRFVRELALSRRYRLGEVRATPGAGERMVRRLGDGGMVRLNTTAALALDLLAGGSPGEVVRALCERNPEVERERIEDDVLAVTRRLTRAGIICPAGARGPVQDMTASSPDLPQVAVGRERKLSARRRALRTD